MDMMKLLLTLVLMMDMSFRFADAGDFALLVDIANATIYAGSMSQRLADAEALPLRGLVSPVAVDYDPVEKMVYWTDKGSQPTHKISRARLDGSNQMIVVDDFRTPLGMALDVESRMLYWSDFTLEHIGRARMDGTGSKEIIVDNLDSPQTIVVDHGNGHIYWTDWGLSRIERANLDGSSRQTIIETDLGIPHGVAIYGSHLYWCDAFLDKIERSDLRGNNRELVLNTTNLLQIHPFDLAVYQDNVYWTDWRYTAVIRVHVNGRGLDIFGPALLQLAGGIHIQEEPDFCDSSPCNHGETCMDVVNGFTCLCPSGSPACSSSGDLCDSGPCVNEGTCIDVPGGFTCQCPAGYDGPTCDSVARCLLTNDPSDVLIVVSVEQAVYLPGDLIEYGCPDGYHLSGSATRYCRSDFSWSGHEPECVMEDRASTAHCVLTLNSSDVLTIVSGQQAVYRPGDSVKYGCPDGYHLRGSATRICLADSKWSGQPAECLMTSLRSDGRAAPVVPIVSGIGSVIFFAVVLAIAITVFIRKRTASYREELVNTPDVAYRTSKDLFMAGTYAEAKETTNEPIYQHSIL